MAKPGTPTTWSSNTNYAGGPRVGTATKAAINNQHKTDGWWPDEKPPAQQQNQWNWEVWQWLEWVFDGSSAGAEDAHIVETDSGGISTLAKLICTGQVAGSLGVQGTGTGNFAGGAFAGGPTNGDGVEGFGNGTGEGGTFTGGSGGGDGVLAVGQAGGDGVVGNGQGAGAGGTFTGGSTSGDGVTATGGGGGIGVRGTGGPTGIGVRGQGGASGAVGVLGVGTSGNHGVQGTGQGSGMGGFFTGGDSSGTGVSGTGGATNSLGGSFSGTGTGTGMSASGGSSNGVGAKGFGNGTGSGLEGYGVNGYGVVAESDTSSPQAAALRVVPQDDDPDTLLEDGGVTYHSGEHTLKVRANAAWMNVWHSDGGLVRAYFESLGLSTSSAQDPNLTTKVTGTAAVRKNNDVLHFRIALEMSFSAADAGFTFDIYDLTGTTNVMSSRSVLNPSISSSADQRYVVAEADYTVPATGTRTYELRFGRAGVSGTAYIRYASMEITGAY